MNVWLSWRFPLFAGLSVILALLFPSSLRLSVVRSLSGMLAEGDPERVAWEKFQEIFGPQEYVLLAYEDPGLFSPTGEGLRRLAGVAGRLRTIPGVADVWSLDQLFGEASVITSPLYHNVWKLFECYTHNSQENMVALLILLEPRPQNPGSSEAGVIQEIACVAYSLPEGVAIGPPMIVEYGFHLVQRDSARAAWTAGVVLAALILLFSRRLRWVVLAVTLIAASVIGAKATFAIVGGKTNLIDSTLIAVITVITVATLMHLVVNFETAQRAGMRGKEALASAVRTLAAPVGLALVTDAIGFGALSISRVVPVRNFALITVLALVWFSVALICSLPAIVLTGESLSTRVGRFVKLLPPPVCRFWPLTGYGKKRGVPFLQGMLRRTLAKALKHRGEIIVIAVLLFGFGLWGWWSLTYETDFMQSFPKTSEIVQGYRKLEHKLGGSGIWDIALPAPPSLTPTYLMAVERLQERLRNEVKILVNGELEPGLSKVLSLADVKSTLDGIPFSANIPSHWKDEWAIRLLKMRMPTLYHAMYHRDPHNSDLWWFRIQLRSRAWHGGKSYHDLIRQVRQIVGEEWPRIREHAFAKARANGKKTPQPSDAGESVTVQAQHSAFFSDATPLVTGYYVILGQLVKNIVAAQTLSFVVAVGGMAILFWIAFKRFGDAFCILVTNLLPIVLLTGALGWTGTRINLGSAMMAAVSLGLSVDISIHYLVAYRRELKRGRLLRHALRLAHETVGTASVYATLALVVGFLTLVRSDFVPTVHFGILLSWTIAIGLLSNLIVLPCLLFITAPLPRKA